MPRAFALILHITCCKLLPLRYQQRPWWWIISLFSYPSPGSSTCHSFHTFSDRPFYLRSGSERSCSVNTNLKQPYTRNTIIVLEHIIVILKSFQAIFLRKHNHDPNILSVGYFAKLYQKLCIEKPDSWDVLIRNSRKNKFLVIASHCSP